MKHVAGSWGTEVTGVKAGPCVLAIAWGAGLAAPAGLVARPDLYNNGTARGGAAPNGLPTGAVTSTNVAAPPGYQWSEIQAGNDALGFSAQSPLGNRLADNFTISDPAGWHVTGVIVFGYVTDTPLGAPSPFTGVSCRIWRGRPGDPGSDVVFGDGTTNRLAGSVEAMIVRGNAAGHSQGRIRAIWANTLAVDTTLPPGEYWIDFSQNAGFNPPVTIAGSRGPAVADARQFLGDVQQWVDLIDPGPLGGTYPPVAQELPFIIRGTIGGGPSCYPNCDGSTMPPVLNVNDFVCFAQRFAAGDPYANCDGSTMPPVLNVADFVCFQSAFAAGCSSP
jgi:hypothetical protein